MNPTRCTDGRLTRRSFLAVAAASATFGGWPWPVSRAHAAAKSRQPTGPGAGRGSIIDVNVSLGRWPTRRLPLDEPAGLVKKLKRYGVRQAWAGSFDALLHRDLRAVNGRLADDCARFGRHLLVPFGTVNPTEPGWEEDLRRCRRVHRMPGIRVFPGYHGYCLSDPAFGALLEAAAREDLIVQIAVAMEDERMQLPLLRVAHVELAPLGDLLARHQRSRIVLLNWWQAKRPAALAHWCETGRLALDIATVEEIEGISKLLGRYPASALLFGSHAPFFYFESAWLKLRESELASADLEAIRRTSAARWLAEGWSARGGRDQNFTPQP